MSIQFSSSTLRFRANQNELQYILKCAPASESIRVTVEGSFEIALGNLAEKTFTKELILLPDTTTSPHKIEKNIFVRKLGPKASGKLIHTIGNQPEKYLLSLETDENEHLETPQTTVKTKPETIVPSFFFNKTALVFGKVAPGKAKVESFIIRSQHIPKYTVEVALPFKISLDNKTFLNTLTVEPNAQSGEKEIFVQVQSLTEGKFHHPVLIRAQNIPARQIMANAVCTLRKPIQLPKAKFWFYFAGIGLAILGIITLFNRKPAENSVSTQPSKVFKAQEVKNIAVSLEDPTCKPSLYQKLKEKSTVVKYGCVSKDCDTTFIREILTFASGSKAFRFVDLHANNANPSCGQWVEQAFRENKADILFSDQNCELMNIDQSHSICMDGSTNTKCTFLIPCGNGDGLLKVINKEIRKRKAKMNILE